MSIDTSSKIVNNKFKNVNNYRNDPGVIRATMGALFHQQLIRTNFDSLRHWIRYWIRRHACGVVGASPEGKVDFHRFKYPSSTILFLGIDNLRKPSII